MDRELYFLLVGAGVALGSSILTTLFTTLLTNWVTKKESMAEKAEKAHYLMGKSATLLSDTTDTAELAGIWEKQAQSLDEFLNASKKDRNKLSGLVGLYEGLEEKINQLLNEKKEKLLEKKLLNETKEKLLNETKLLEEKLLNETKLLEEKEN